MRFYPQLQTDTQFRIATLKAAHAKRTDLTPDKVIPMVNGTRAHVYTTTIGRLLTWPFGDAYLDDHVDIFLMSNAARGPILYEFSNSPTTLYIGKSLNGFTRPLVHITGSGGHNKALYQYLTKNRPQSLDYTITLYALAMSPDLPNNLIETTVLACESNLIKSTPTLFNVLHNKRQ